jgi:hypothetical protein
LRPRPADSSRNRSSRGRVARSSLSCVMVRGILTAKRNPAGVDAAHRAYVATPWGRWKEELISAQGSTRA